MSCGIALPDSCGEDQLADAIQRYRRKARQPGNADAADASGRGVEGRASRPRRVARRTLPRIGRRYLAAAGGLVRLTHDPYRAGGTAFAEGRLGEEMRLVTQRLLLRCSYRHVDASRDGQPERNTAL
jgi:hypothetical protein